VGYAFPQVAPAADAISHAFLRLVKTIVSPLLFGTLVVGIAGHSNIRQVGRMGWKALLYFEVVTTLALFVGLAAINLSQAGAGISVPAGLQGPTAPKAQSAGDVFLHLFPENIAKSVAEGQVLQVVVFSVLFGIALALVREEKRKPMLAFAESLTETMFKFTAVVMYMAPIGVGAAIAYTVSSLGVGVLGNLLQLLLTLYGALICFIVLVLLPIAWFTRIPIRGFVQAVSSPVALAFATASSEAALPTAMESMERFGVPRKVVAFVMPTGYSFNLDGTTLYLSLADEGGATESGMMRLLDALPAGQPFCFSDRRKELRHATALHGLLPEALQFLMPTKADWLTDFGMVLRCERQGGAG
jgi:proton glutamate symport protein